MSVTASHVEANGAETLPESFRELADAQRVEIHAHCYRMLGSLHDADDAVQETLLRAWRGLPGFRGRSSLRTWLYRIATNVCLDAIKRRPNRVLPIDYGETRESDTPIAAHRWIEPYPDEELGVPDGSADPEARYEQREALELAFVAALQHLPPRQRAALVLRDVLGFSAKEAAAALETTVPAVNGALQRARSTIADRLPDRSQQATLRALGDRRLREIAERFAEAFEAGDIEAIVALLAESCTFGMPPYPGFARGRDEVAESWLMPSGPAPRLRYVPASANGQLALGTYLREGAGDTFVPLALDVLTLGKDGLVRDVIAFREPALFERFGLPARLRGEPPDRGARPRS